VRRGDEHGELIAMLRSAGYQVIPPREVLLEQAHLAALGDMEALAIAEKIRDLMPEIIGMRGMGKTTLFHQLSENYHRVSVGLMRGERIQDLPVWGMIKVLWVMMGRGT